jgi:antitoxin YefM
LLVVRKRICGRQPSQSHLTASGLLVLLLTMTVLPLGDAKAHLSELVGRVHDHHERVTVTVHGRPSAILIAPEDLEALEETLEIMRDAATMNRFAESDAELARGEYVSAEELDRQDQAEQEQIVLPVGRVDLEGGGEDALFRQRGDDSLSVADGVLTAQEAALRDELPERRVDGAVVPAEELMPHLGGLPPVDDHLMPSSERRPPAGGPPR